MFAYCNNSPVNFSDPAGNMMVNISNGADDVKRLYVGPALNHSDTSFGSLIGNAIGSLWEGASSVLSDAAESLWEDVNNLWNRVESIDWNYVAKETLKAATGAAVGGAAAGAAFGSWGIPVSAGLSIPACAFIGGIGGAIEGGIAGLIVAIWDELED